MLSKYIIHSKCFKNFGDYCYYYCYLKHRRATKIVRKFENNLHNCFLGQSSEFWRKENRGSTELSSDS